MEYGGFSSTSYGPPSRPPKDVIITPPPPLRPPRPPPPNVSCGAEEPPIVPPRRRNSPALINTVQVQETDLAAARPPVRPSSRAVNEVVTETSLVGRPVSQLPTATSRPSLTQSAATKNDDVTSTESSAKAIAAPSTDKEASHQKQHPPVRMFFYL